jgi:protocatechuate 3,4-dioxygenase beta subunit
LSLFVLLLLTTTYATAGTISGVIRNGSGVAVSGLSVGLYQGTTLSKSATTNADGRYYFTDVANGLWLVRPSHTGHSFAPLYRSLTVPPDVTNADFTVSESATTSAISGVIRNGTGAAVAGVSVGLYKGDALQKSATTNADGRYYFTELAAGAYVVMASQTGKSFSPAYRAITVPPTVTNADFTMSEVAGSAISGVIRNGAGSPVASISVGLYQADVLKKSATTNADGRYYFTELAAGSYVVKPAQTGKIFSPAERTIAVPPTTSIADFTVTETATSVISGIVKTATGVGVANISVGLYQGDVLLRSTTTITNGRYYFTGLATGAYVVRPTQTDRTFDPVHRAVTVPPTVTNADFTITEAAITAISGVVRTAAGAAVAGVSVGLYQADVLKGSTTTNADGRYYFTGLASGAYVVRPAQIGTVFDPLQKVFIVPPAVTNGDFVITETPVLSAISGVIRNANEVPMLGVTVGLFQGDVSRGTSITNGDGRYYFTGLAAGTYVVKPVKSGVVFDPLTKSVTVPPTTSIVNFKGTTVETGSAIAGQIKNLAGTPLQGVSVSLYLHDVLKKSGTTNAEGRYYFTGLESGTYVVRPAKEGLIFDPLAKAVTVPPTTSVVNFTGKSQPHPPVLAEGRVSPTTGTTRTLFTFAVVYTDAANREPGTAGLIVDGIKSYRMVKQNAEDTNFADGCTYIYKLMLASGNHKFRFVFGTAGQVAMLPGPTEYEFFSGPTVTGEDYAVGGLIMCGTSRLEGVTVTVAGDGEPVVVQTNAEGRFLATHLKPGVYTVVPAMEGYLFTPDTKTVIVPPGTTSCNFQAAVQ